MNPYTTRLCRSERFTLHRQGSTFVDPNTTGYILSTIQVQPLLTRIYLCGPRHNLLYCIDQKDQLLLTPTQLTTFFQPASFNHYRQESNIADPDTIGHIIFTGRLNLFGANINLCGPRHNWLHGSAFRIPGRGIST